MRTALIKALLVSLTITFAAPAFGQDSRIPTARISLGASATDSTGKLAGAVKVVLTCNAFGLNLDATLDPTPGVELQQNAPNRNHAHAWTTSSVSLSGTSPSLIISEDDQPNALHFNVMGPQLQQDKSGFAGLAALAQAFTGETSIGSVDQFFASSEVSISTPARLRNGTGLVVIRVPTASNEVQSFRKACTDLTNVPPKPTGADLEKTVAYAEQYLNFQDKPKLNQTVSLFQEGRSTGDRQKMRRALSSVSILMYRNDVLRPVYDQMNAIIQGMSDVPSRR